MFSKKNTIYFMSLLMLAISFIKPVMAADDDDDNILGEIAADIAGGVFMAVCETSTACTEIMNIICVFSLVVALILCCMNPEQFCNDCCRPKTFRRSATSYATYKFVGGGR